jgi:hypothetical protein
MTVYVVDQDGATFVFRSRRRAQRALVAEAWRGATHLTITRATTPKGMRGDALVTWCIANVAPTTCDAQ